MPARSGSTAETVGRLTPLQMIERGIAVIYQETMLAPHLSVAENLFLGRLPKTRLGIIDWREAIRRSEEMLDAAGLPGRSPGPRSRI